MEINFFFFYTEEKSIIQLSLYNVLCFRNSCDVIRSTRSMLFPIANNDELHFLRINIYRLLLNSWPRAANNDNSKLPRVTKRNKARSNSIYARALGGFFSFLSFFFPPDFIPFSIRLCFIEGHYRHPRGLCAFNCV